MPRRNASVLDAFDDARARSFGFSSRNLRANPLFGTQGAESLGQVEVEEHVCTEQELGIERRSWPRLPLAIPVFVRTHGDDGKDFLEFATAMNVSAGGALVVLRRSLPLAAQVLLEIPIHLPPLWTLDPRPRGFCEPEPCV